jgi:low affinity Fe/Cu permease
MIKLFQHISKHISNWMGHPFAFILAILTIVVWALSGPLFGFSDTWQLVINTGTTIVTFLMVFLIQNTQNRDTRALQLKLDELIRASADARNKLIDLEDLSDEDMEQLQKEFCELKDHYEDRVDEIKEHRHKRHSKHHK